MNTLIRGELLVITDGSDDSLSSDWLDSVLKFTTSTSSGASTSSKEAKGKEAKKELKPKPPANKPAIPAKPTTATKPAPPPSTDYMLEHIHQRFTELAACTLAAANSAVTSETEARAMVKSDQRGQCLPNIEIFSVNSCKLNAI